MRCLCHSISRDQRNSERGDHCCSEFFVKRCAATADETKRHRRTRVFRGSTVKENAVNGGHCCVPRHTETDDICPKQVSREPACAREIGAATTRQSCQ